MGTDYYDTGTFRGYEQRSSTESLPRAGQWERELDPAIDDLASMSHYIHNHLFERLDIAMRAKRIFDIVSASVAIALLWPVMAIAAILIKLESRGPVFFTQERIGLNRRRDDRRRAHGSTSHERRGSADRRKQLHAGRPFRIYKFRTMIEDAERGGVPMLASEDDPRITRVGKLFRKTRIDELPQLINVLRGDMSMIGPRPERSFFINQMRVELPEFTTRLSVKPGITGLAQVESGYTSTLEQMKDKLFYDLKYIKDISPVEETKILFKTVAVVVTGKGAC